MIAYLVSPADPHINRPLARVMLSPFSPRPLRDALTAPLHSLTRIFDRSAQRGTQVWNSGTLYGLKSQGFAQVVEKFIAEQFNADCRGRFWLQPGVYRDWAHGAPKIVRCADGNVSAPGKSKISTRQI